MRNLHQNLSGCSGFHSHRSVRAAVPKLCLREHQFTESWTQMFPYWNWVMGIIPQLPRKKNKVNERDFPNFTSIQVSLKETSILWEVIPSVIQAKKCICTYVLFRTFSEIELFHCTVPKLLISERYYVLFLITVFIVHATELVQFT
jgi:hypothetical protein